MNCHGFSEIALFLSKTHNPLFTDGWTLLLNPFQQICYLNTTTGVSNCTEQQASSQNVTEPVYLWSPTTMHVDLNDITITSMYADMPVQFAVDFDAALTNYPTGHTCVVFIFAGTGVTVSNIHFDVSTCGAAGFINTDFVSLGAALVPVQFISLDAHNTTLSSLEATGALAVAIMSPDSSGDMIAIHGTTATDLHVRDPRVLPWFNSSSSFLGLVLMAFAGTDVVLDVTPTISVWNWKYPTVTVDISGDYTSINTTLVVVASPHSIACPECPDLHEFCLKHDLLHHHLGWKEMAVLAAVIILVAVIMIKCLMRCCRRCCKHTNDAILAASFAATKARVRKEDQRAKLDVLGPTTIRRRTQATTIMANSHTPDERDSS
jgi:hypothetical protein